MSRNVAALSSRAGRGGAHAQMKSAIVSTRILATALRDDTASRRLDGENAAPARRERAAVWRPLR